MSFASLRSQILALESETVNSATVFAGFIENVSSVITPREEEVMNEITSLLLKRDNLIKKLDEISENDTKLSMAKLQQLQRHKEVLNEHRRDFQRIKGQIETERNRMNLLTSVRSDLDERRNRKSNNGGSGGEGGIDEIDYINEERQRANNAHSVVDSLLDQAYRTRDELVGQNSVLANAGKRLGDTVSRFPIINNVIMKIGTRRRRDSIIMTSVISVCVIVFFYLL